MKRHFALLTEARWAQGKLRTQTERLAFACELWLGLRAAHPHSRVHANGLQEICTDLNRVLQCLTYGGRKPSDIPPARLRTLLQTKV